jgi:hypothetical protein
MVLITSNWSDEELDACILTLCAEFPDARMTACSRALEHCRSTTPYGTIDSLVSAMRHQLRGDPESQRLVYDYDRRTVEAHDPVTRERVYARTLEPALSTARDYRAAGKADYEQARCHITGEMDRDIHDVALACGQRGARTKIEDWAERWSAA